MSLAILYLSPDLRVLFVYTPRRRREWNVNKHFSWTGWSDRQVANDFLLRSIKRYLCYQSRLRLKWTAFLSRNAGAHWRNCGKEKRKKRNKEQESFVCPVSAVAITTLSNSGVGQRSSSVRMLDCLLSLCVCSLRYRSTTTNLVEKRERERERQRTNKKNRENRREGEKKKKSFSIRLIRMTSTCCLFLLRTVPWGSVKKDSLVYFCYFV